jgi:hypothetical protein
LSKLPPVLGQKSRKHQFIIVRLVLTSGKDLCMIFRSFMDLAEKDVSFFLDTK